MRCHGHSSAGTAEPKRKTRFTLGRWGRFAVGAVLVLAFLVSIGWIWLGSPLPLRQSIALALLAAICLTIFVGVFIKQDLPKHWKRAIAAGTGLISLVATLVGLPVLRPEGPGPGAVVGTPAASSPTSTASSDPDPLTATLDFNDPKCEDYTVPKSLLPSLPKNDAGIDPQWIYEHGGATLGGPVLTVQGESEDAVVLKRLRVVDLERHRPPSSAIGVLSCGPAGGDMNVRYIEIKMDKPPQVVARPAPFPDEDVKEKPAVKFPIKVSNSDPEFFVLQISGPECFCDWRLAIDWTSGGRSGTTVVDHGFGKIRSDTREHKQRPLYAWYEGKWQEL